MLVVRAALAGKSLPASQCVLAAPACQSWRRLALRARRRWRGRCAPGACGEPDLRLALRARRSAHGAARRGRCAPVSCVRSGAAAGCHRRLALRARRRGRGRCAPGRLRQPFRRLALRARRRTRGRCAPGRLHVVPPRKRARVASWWWGCRRRRALRADRDACRKARFALLPRARMGRGVSDFIMHERAGQRLRASAACAVQVGAARHCNRSAFSPG